MALNKLLAQVNHIIDAPGFIDPTGDPTSRLEKLLSSVIGILTVIGFIYFAFQIILAGYAYITSQGDQKNMETARKRLTEGVLGIFIVVVAVGVTRLIAHLAGMDNVLDLNSMFIKLGL